MTTSEARCACKHPEAKACFEARYPECVRIGDDRRYDPEERCDCSCHDLDEDDRFEEPRWREPRVMPENGPRMPQDAIPKRDGRSDVQGRTNGQAGRVDDPGAIGARPFVPSDAQVAEAALYAAVRDLARPGRRAARARHVRRRIYADQALLVAVPAVPGLGPTVLGALGVVASEVARADGPDLAGLGGIDTTDECPGTPGLWVWEGSITAHAAGDCFEGTWRPATAGDLARFGLAMPADEPTGGP